MMFRDFIAFGSYAERIKENAICLANQTGAIARYVADTKRGAGQAEYDLLFAAEMLEHGALRANETAQELRKLHARIEQKRADLSNPHLIAAE
jgi:hypothetical protein